MTRKLRRAFGHYATGVTVVTTTTAGGERAGITVNSFSSLSLDPPLVLWSIARTAATFASFREAGAFAVHVLHAGQAHLARQFALRGGDRFAGVSCATGPSGAPLLDDFLACFDCETYATHEGGDHLVIVGRVLESFERSGEPLLFYRGRFVERCRA
ncbi:MAG TPA: flavin reductase family protein [Steroidobacteraceae bacterium]|nr:flavin reductase family protein [Steroidobacteraceae bacterium]